MACWDNYITISEDIMQSRSGLFATDLPGIDTDMLDAIARSSSDDYEDIYATIYKRAYRNLVSDTAKQLSEKFYRDLKLVSRETSKFKDDTNASTGYAGVTLEFTLPKYARLHVISVGVFSLSNYTTPGFTLKFFDEDSGGELLDTVNEDISIGRNTINIDQDFEVDKLFIAYNASTYSLRQTENKYYEGGNTYFDSVVCDVCLVGGTVTGSVVQTNYGGLNVKYIIYCSDEKFVCENINLFKDALLYKIGHEITIERRLGERLSEFSIMSKERWDELEAFYGAQYEKNLMNVIGSSSISEDEICYACKNTVRQQTVLP